MRKRKGMAAPPIDDDPTIRDEITPDMLRVAARGPLRAERRWSILSQIATGVVLPTAVAAGWWIGVEGSTVSVPELVAPLPVLESTAAIAEPPADDSDEEAEELGDTIPVVALADLPLEVEAGEKVAAPPRAVGSSKHWRLRSKRKSAKPATVDVGF